ncbi:NifX-associated nitrogen fixation protein [Frankia sp. AgPm24]|uniref:NifX-associated nitrogen fixation protein n=1 Tax=Frankia umida TaxID=573489 RepID=A0ABT0JUA6_9ACTN|nr:MULTISPECIES: NifX-associated nitrogen fixation protein [Frankia]MCK9874975.1 NifX-associated nitrogen fixation protein [Frankia umida]MCK9920521.1 NifX-associated nitrogen fixation protein [Frankia sp. AgPm24]
MTEMSGFLRDLVAQTRAGDTYGQLSRFSDEQMLAPFVLTKEQRRAIPAACDLEAATEARVRSFYQAVAAATEKATGAFTVAILDLNHEGFGRVIIFAGRLVVVDEALRDIQRFGFDSLDKLGARGESLVIGATKVIDQYREVTRDDA